MFPALVHGLGLDTLCHFEWYIDRAVPQQESISCLEMMGGIGAIYAVLLTH